jgi:hypothetical protein
MNKTAKKISRRSALKLLAGGSLSAALGTPTFALAQSRRYAKLADTFRCIGCKRWNGLEMDRYELITDRNTDLTANSWVVVNLRADSDNRTQRHYQHWACQHCERTAPLGFTRIVIPKSASTSKKFTSHTLIHTSAFEGAPPHIVVISLKPDINVSAIYL